MSIKSATIVLQRTNGEVLLCKRSSKVSFFPNAWVFPGGKLEEEISDWKGDEPVVVDTVLREAFEEVGLILGDPKPAPPERRNGEWKAHEGVEKWRNRILFAGRRQTPPFDNKLYDTSYFLFKDAFLDTWEAVPDGEEIVRVEWARPKDIISQFERGERHLPPPVLYVLRLLQMHGTAMVHVGREDTHKPPGVQTPVEFAHRIEVVPLPSNTAPPFATTSLGILRGDDKTLLVDPGWNSSFTWFEELMGTVTTDEVVVFVTHHHSDHWMGLKDIERKFPEAVVYAHPETLKHLDTSLKVKGTTGTELDLGDLTVQLIHAPGHTGGHMILFEPRTRTVYAGDHVVGRGTALLDPLSGDMREYMRTLDLIEELRPRMIIPSHGRPNFRPGRLLENYRKHRLEREQQVLSSVRRGAKSTEEVLEEVYAAVPRKMWRYARYNVELHLKKLFDEGRITTTDDGYRAKD